MSDLNNDFDHSAYVFHASSYFFSLNNLCHITLCNIPKANNQVESHGFFANTSSYVVFASSNLHNSLKTAALFISKAYCSPLLLVFVFSKKLRAISCCFV